MQRQTLKQPQSHDFPAPPTETFFQTETKSRDRFELPTRSQPEMPTGSTRYKYSTTHSDRSSEKSSENTIGTARSQPEMTYTAPNRSHDQTTGSNVNKYEANKPNYSKAIPETNTKPDTRPEVRPEVRSEVTQNDKMANIINKFAPSQENTENAYMARSNEPRSIKPTPL